MHLRFCLTFVYCSLIYKKNNNNKIKINKKNYFYLILLFLYASNKIPLHPGPLPMESDHFPRSASGKQLSNKQAPWNAFSKLSFPLWNLTNPSPSLTHPLPIHPGTLMKTWNTCSASIAQLQQTLKFYIKSNKSNKYIF